MARTPAPKQTEEASGRIDPEGTSLQGVPQTDLIPAALKVAGMAYQWVPISDIQEYLRPKTMSVGGEVVTRPPWVTVKDDMPAEFRPRSMDAQGHAIDGHYTHGQQVAICIPEKWVALEAQANEELVDNRERMLERGSEARAPGARLRKGQAHMQDGDGVVPPYVSRIVDNSQFLGSEG